MKNNYSILLILGLIIISSCTDIQDPQKTCTSESRLCPDGSSVGRNPNNNCVFDPCPENNDLPQEEEKLAEPEMIKIPYVTLEATVTSIILNDLPLNCETSESCPKDKVTVRIEKIDRSNDPDNQINSDSQIELDVGDELKALDLKYTARAAKLVFDIPPKCPSPLVLSSGSCIKEGCEGPECMASSPIYEEAPVEQADNYLVFHFPQSDEEDVILPGIKEGSIIKFKFWGDPVNTEIAEYELISN